VEEPQFVLNATTLAAIGGVMGVLTGAISFLTRSLLKSKNDQIKALTSDRDYWRAHVMHEIETLDSRVEVAAQPAKPAPRKHAGDDTEEDPAEDDAAYRGKR
jgi:hypothetical protein